jgi:hypothetical protein
MGLLAWQRLVLRSLLACVTCLAGLGPGVMVQTLGLPRCGPLHLALLHLALLNC